MHWNPLELIRIMLSYITFQGARRVRGARGAKGARGARGTRGARGARGARAEAGVWACIGIQ